MKKFKNASGTVFAPKSEAVEAMMLVDKRLTVVPDKKPAKKPVKKEAPKAPEAVTE